MAADSVKPGDFYENLVNAFRWQGKHYGLPKDWSPLGMVYDEERPSLSRHRGTDRLGHAQERAARR